MRTSFLKEQEYKINLVGNNFTSCPSEEYSRVYITGEIVSAQEFAAEEIYVTYSIKLPEFLEFEFPEEVRLLQPTEEQFQEFNCSQSVTQSTEAVIDYSQEGKEQYTFNLCFPIDLQLLLSENERTAKTPVLYFEVFSIDSWDRTVMMGCGFVNIPISPGTCEMRIPTWKPMAGLYSKVSEFFLGGSSKVKNIQEISSIQMITQNGTTAPQNKILTHTESSGNVNFRFNVAVQSKALKNESRKIAKIKNLSEQVEIEKEKKPNNPMASFMNVGNGSTARYTTTKLI